MLSGVSHHTLLVKDGGQPTDSWKSLLCCAWNVTNAVLNFNSPGYTAADDEHVVHALVAEYQHNDS